MQRPASSRVRLEVLGMLFVTVAINYLDRSNLSVAATGLSRDLQLDPVRLGLIFSGFGWTYALFQIPGGWLVDRIGPRTPVSRKTERQPKCACAMTRSGVKNARPAYWPAV